MTQPSLIRVARPYPYMPACIACSIRTTQRKSHAAYTASDACWCIGSGYARLDTTQQKGLIFEPGLLYEHANDAILFVLCNGSCVCQVLYIQAFVMIWHIVKALKYLFFGELRPVEVEVLKINNQPNLECSYNT